MTIAIGAKCLDGVAMVADRRMVRQGGLEVSLPEVKLSRFGGVIIARVGVQPFYDALERALSEEAAVTCWDVGDTVDALVARYAMFKTDCPVFPIGVLVNGQAHLYQVMAGCPPAEVAYQVWGIAEEYGAIGRLFPWEESPVDVAWRVMAMFVRAAARASVAVGDGIDAALLRDGVGIEMVGDTNAVWDEAERALDEMLAVVKLRMQGEEVIRAMAEISRSDQHP
jgi:hypothetical protein